MAWEKEQARARNASQPVSTGSALRFTMTARLITVESPLVGQINVYNILAAWCAAYTYRDRAGGNRARHCGLQRRTGTV